MRQQTGRGLGCVEGTNGPLGKTLLQYGRGESILYV